MICFSLQLHILCEGERCPNAEFESSESCSGLVLHQSAHTDEHKHSSIHLCVCESSHHYL